MRIAVVGGGVSGLVAAWLLAREHEVVLYEAENRIGGHAHTSEVDFGDGPIAVDTGFIVFNHRTYPLFRRVLQELGVPEKLSNMSFSASIPSRGIEYNGASFNKLFAQRRNLIRPSFWRMVRGILRFYKESRELLSPEAAEVALGEYLQKNRYAREFVDDHLVPMAAAVWSTDRERMMDFPARFLVRFFDHHGFLEVDNRPAWFTVEGGSREYVAAISRQLGGAVRSGTPVKNIARLPKHSGSSHSMRVTSRESVDLFDQVVLATHSDTTLRLLEDPTKAEGEVLSALPYQNNVAQLHSDASVMPKKRRAWASWNYHVGRNSKAPPTITYWMNLLQGIESPEPLFVTLNRQEEIDPAKVHGQWNYAHPLYTAQTVAAQMRRLEIQGVDRIWYAGAYWGYGFHEDGVRSAVEVARRLGVPFAEDLPEREIDRLLTMEAVT
ncbi:MAG: FAD-dependent oxidoreductase [Planctomycetes bacterium]|nr:FAD-dependent oxidoreductase [Planctomycetota bacterium]